MFGQKEVAIFWQTIANFSQWSYGCSKYRICPPPVWPQTHLVHSQLGNRISVALCKSISWFWLTGKRVRWVQSNSPKYNVRRRRFILHTTMDHAPEHILGSGLLTQYLWPSCLTSGSWRCWSQCAGLLRLLMMMTSSTGGLRWGWRWRSQRRLWSPCQPVRLHRTLTLQRRQRMN